MDGFNDKGVSNDNNNEADKDIIQLKNINSRTLEFVVKYANNEVIQLSILDQLRYFLSYIVLILLVMSSCYMIF